MFKKDDIKFIDPVKTFEINLDMKVSVEVIPGTRDSVLIVDDFYKNPEMVENLIKSIPTSVVDSLHGSAYSGYRTELRSVIQNKVFHDILTNLARSAFKLDGLLTNDAILTVHDRNFIVNIHNDKPSLDNSNRRLYPHYDTSLFAALVYFHDDPTATLGTAIFKHKKSGMVHVPYHDSQKKLDK